MNIEQFYLRRTLCDVLQEMRDCFKTLNLAAIKGLIEEAQIMGDRMESALGQQRDLQRMEEMWHTTKENLKKLKDLEKKRRERLGLSEEDAIPNPMLDQGTQC